ncbi:MAG: hypothetical protein V2J07_00820 [Anaerolineae bacterium]|jgi:polyhydroxyalkanoate synthesis regulator phasin|nr:hypothetical protein [Anaerolineae bacterium]
MKKTKWMNLGLVVIAIMLVGVLAFVVAGEPVFAADGDDPEIEPTDDVDENDGLFSGSGPGPNHPGRESYGRFLRYGKEAMLASIAEQTGISVEELESVLADRVRLEDFLMEAGYSEAETDEILLNAQYAVIDQAVAEGKLTDEEAAEAKLKAADFAEQRQEWAANREAYHQIWVDLIAEKSGLDPADIEAALGYGGNVHQLLEESFSKEEAHAIIEEAWSEMIDQALAEGLISEEQADQLAAHPPFNGDRMRNGIRERISENLEERFGENWKDEFQRRMNPDCDCTCPEDGDA